MSLFLMLITSNKLWKNLQKICYQINISLTITCFLIDKAMKLVWKLSSLLSWGNLSVPWARGTRTFSPRKFLRKYPPKWQAGWGWRASSREREGELQTYSIVVYENMHDTWYSLFCIRVNLPFCDLLYYLPSPYRSKCALNLNVKSNEIL